MSNPGATLQSSRKTAAFLEEKHNLYQTTPTKYQTHHDGQTFNSKIAKSCS